jgi:hypothetical protein
MAITTDRAEARATDHAAHPPAARSVDRDQPAVVARATMPPATTGS